MKLKLIIAAIFAAALSWSQANAAATLLPNGEQCFQATVGLNGMVGTIAAPAGGSNYVSGSYGGVSLTGGSGIAATANIIVAAGAVTSVVILNPGTQYIVGDVLSASAASIGGSGSGFSVAVLSTSINSSLAGGTVAFYIPNTLTPKTTWFNPDQASIHQNTNPVNLDANGCAVVYGIGSYRQILKDSLGNTVWDKLTTDTSANNSVFWAGTAGGTPNAITVVDPGFNGTDGSIIQFVALSTNTGPATLNPSGFGAISITKATTTGPAVLAAGDIVQGNVVTVTYSASANTFQIVGGASSAASAGSPVVPQGYLTLLPAFSGGPVMGASDVVAATSVYYSPIVGTQIPVWNGTAFVNLTFPELQLTMTSSWLANSIYDGCVFSNNGVATLVTGPAWQTSTAGLGARGTGPGTTQLSRLNGLWTNAVAITGANGASTFSIPANQCTYVGSISMDGTNGQVSAYRTSGQSRKFGVWNAYNRQKIILQTFEPVSGWTNTPTTWRQSFADVANFAMAFSGLPEELVDASFTQNITVLAPAGNTNIANIGIGINVTNSPTGMFGVVESALSGGTSVATQGTAKATAVVLPFIGLNQINMIEQAPSGTTNDQFQGTVGNNLLTLNWRG